MDGSPTLLQAAHVPTAQGAMARPDSLCRLAAVTGCVATSHDFKGFSNWHGLSLTKSVQHKSCESGFHLLFPSLQKESKAPQHNETPHEISVQIQEDCGRMQRCLVIPGSCAIMLRKAVATKGSFKEHPYIM